MAATPLLEMHLEEMGITKFGYLVKSPPMDGANRLIPKRWMLRWFVLKDGCLHYYKDLQSWQNEDQPKGILIYFERCHPL